jgi:poly-gamma-glutamate capsule biosynthesis protein CapA/YwtB (metallophosphatase superfamily)
LSTFFINDENKLLLYNSQLQSVKKRLPPFVAISTIVLLGLVTAFCFWYFATAYAYPSSTDIGQQPQANNTPTATPNQPVTLIAVGDIMLSRNVEQKMINKNDWLYPFRQTYETTTKGDIVFANLETPLIAGPIVNTGTMVFRADPKAVAGLTFGGFNILSLANNHIKNKGTAGIDSTIAALDAANIKHTGAGDNATAAQQPAIIEINGKKFGFLAYVQDGFTPASYEATATQSGSPFLNEETLISDLEKIQPQVDVMIVSMHAGVEYTLAPTAKQKSFAHTAIDHGAALVIGHHPHVVEPIEQYHDGYILYSLGNFIFDQMWSEETRQGALATVTFLDNIVTDVKLTAVKIYDYSQPRILNDAEGEAIVKRMTDFTF